MVVLRDGRIEQHGSPLFLYDSPANRFVAQVIGTPSMNVVPAALLPRLAALSGGAAPAGGFVGIRPEHVHVLDQAQPGSLPATVDMVESLGVATLVCARLENNVQVVARGSEPIALQPGAHAPGVRTRLRAPLRQIGFHVRHASAGMYDDDNRIEQGRADASAVNHPRSRLRPQHPGARGRRAAASATWPGRRRGNPLDHGGRFHGTDFDIDDRHLNLHCLAMQLPG